MPDAPPASTLQTILDQFRADARTNRDLGADKDVARNTAVLLGHAVPQNDKGMLVV